MYRIRIHVRNTDLSRKSSFSATKGRSEARWDPATYRCGCGRGRWEVFFWGLAGVRGVVDHCGMNIYTYMRLHEHTCVYIYRIRAHVPNTVFFCFFVPAKTSNSLQKEKVKLNERPPLPPPADSPRSEAEAGAKSRQWNARRIGRT